jgi:hypothetical protein
MPFQFRIFSAEGTGVSGAGGGPVNVNTTTLVPGGVVSPYQGQGAKYVYRKYFLNIVQFSDDTAPVISNVAVSNITASGARVTWDTDVATTTTVVYDTSLVYGYSVTSGGVLTSGSHTGNLAGLSENTTYYYKIDAYDANGVYAFYASSFNTLDVTAPIISNLQVSNINDNSAKVTWTTNEPATSKLLYAPSVDVAFLSTAYDTNLVTAHTVNLTSLTSGTEYKYRAVSLDSSLNSGQSPINFFTTTQSVGVPALSITGVTSGNITNSGATFNWYTTNRADTLLTYASNLSGLFGVTGVNSIGLYNSIQDIAHTGVITGASPGNSYWVRLKATDIYGQEAYSPTGQTGWYFSTIDTVAPTIFFSGVNVVGTNATVRFTTSELATGFVSYATQDYYNSNAAFSNIKTGSLLTAHAITLNSLTAPETYVYQISAYDSAHNQGLDSIRTFNTADTTAPVISALQSGVTCSGVTFIWQTNEAATSVMQLGTTPYNLGSFTGNLGGYVTDHSAVLRAGLLPTTSYYYNISSADAAGNISNVSGQFLTSGCNTGVLDTVPPVISNITAVPSTTTAAISWDTSELSSTVLYYGVSSPPTTGITGQSGVIGHTVNITTLPTSSTIYYQIEATDTSENTSTTAIRTFETTADSSSSNFSIGQAVTTIEFEVPTSISSVLGTYIPVRGTVPVLGDADLVLNWATSWGDIVQREIVKRGHNGEPSIVEVIFPVPKSALPAAGSTTTFTLYASQNTTAVTWDQYTVPADLEVFLSMPDNQKSKASMANALNAITTQMRGNANSPYMRTYKIYNRCMVQTPNAYHPDLESVGVHSYITYYNKNLFPDFYPQIDIRLNNAWMDVDNGAPTNRGVIYYNAIAINHPNQTPNGVLYGVACEFNDYMVNDSASSLVLVKRLAATPPVAQPLGNGIYLGGSLANYNALYANDTSNNGFLQGTILEYRLCLYNKAQTSTSKILGQQVAGLEYVGYCVYSTVAQRSWSMVAAFGPLNIFCPTLNSSFKYNSYSGRQAYDQKAKVTWQTIRNNLINGTYISDPLAGGSAGYVNNNPSLGPIPVQYGPYRPAGDTNGAAPGGFQITPFEGFNHSKYSTLWMMQDHKMKIARHHQFMYTAGPTYNDDGEPASLTRWISNPVNQINNPTMRNGASNIVGCNPCNFLLDGRLQGFTTSLNDGATLNPPWNAPTVPVTAAHLPGEGCSYHDDRVSYGSGYESDPGNGRYHLINHFTVIDHQHQIRYAANLYAVVELTNDMMIKDDLMMQAEMNIISFAHRPMTNQYYWNGYNLAEWYYGADRQTISSSPPGILSNLGFGIPFGRGFGWPLYTIMEAYQLGTTAFRTNCKENLDLWGKIIRDASMPNGALTRFNPGTPQLYIQHLGQYHNGVVAYLRPDINSNYNGYGNSGYKLTSIYDSAPGFVDTTLTIADGLKLIDRFQSTTNIYNYNSDGLYTNSLTLAAGQGIVFKYNSLLTGFKVNCWGKVQSGSGTARYFLQAVLRDVNTGIETVISDFNTGESPSFGTTLTNQTWTVAQIDSNGAVNMPVVTGPEKVLVFNLYARIEFGSSVTLRTYYGSLAEGVNTSFKITTTIEDTQKPLYDASQAFEIHMMNLGTMSLVRGYLKTEDPTLSTNISTKIQNFYNKFFQCPRTDLSIPGTSSGTSTWLRYSNGIGAETWLIAMGGSGYGSGGETQPFGSFSQGAGKYSFDSDSFQYVPWSSYIGMLAEQEIGTSFSLTLEPTIAYSPGYLLHKWAQMGTPHITAQAHRDAIWAESQSSDGSTSNNSFSRASNSSAVAGHINYKELNPGSSSLTTNLPSIGNVRVYVSQESNPIRAEIAATPNRSDVMTGPSVINGRQTDAVWTTDSIDTTKLEFSEAHGIQQAVPLYNNDGELGGQINVSSSIDDSVPFWIRYRFDENSAERQGNIRINVIAGDGVVGGSSTVPSVDPGTGTSGIFATSNPSGEFYYFKGSEAAGVNGYRQVGSRHILSYDGEERLDYILNFAANSGNANGMIRIYESSSDSFPVWNGGLTYRSVSNTIYTPTQLTGLCTLQSLSNNGYNTIVAQYRDDIDGGRNKQYTFVISGKCLRIKMECTDNNELFAGNYSTAGIGIATGVENPVTVEYDGNGATPTCIFDGPNNSRYYWSAFADLSQSNAITADTPIATGATVTADGFSSQFTLTYGRTPNLTAIAPVNETFNVTVASKLGDVFPVSSAPKSPYYDNRRTRRTY